MRPVHRGHVNKFRSAKKFRHQSGKTHHKNMQIMPQRGGWRL